MIKSFADKGTQELYSKGKSKKFPADVASRAARKLEYVNLAEQLEGLESAARQSPSPTIGKQAGAVRNFNKRSVAYLFSF